MRCTKCGAVLPEDAIFCGKCGVRLKKVPTPASEGAVVISLKKKPLSGLDGRKEAAPAPEEAAPAPQSGAPAPEEVAPAPQGAAPSLEEPGSAPEGVLADREDGAAAFETLAPVSLSEIQVDLSVLEGLEASWEQKDEASREAVSPSPEREPAGSLAEDSLPSAPVSSPFGETGPLPPLGDEELEELLRDEKEDEEADVNKERKEGSVDWGESAEVGRGEEFGRRKMSYERVYDDELVYYEGEPHVVSAARSKRRSAVIGTLAIAATVALVVLTVKTLSGGSGQGGKNPVSVTEHLTNAPTPGSSSGSVGRVDSSTSSSLASVESALSGIVSAIEGGTPATESGRPGAESGQPGAESGQPGAESGQPGVASGQSGVASGQPGAESGQSGAESGQSGAESGQPGAESGQPATASGESGAESGTSSDASHSGRRRVTATPTPTLLPTMTPTPRPTATPTPVPKTDADHIREALGNLNAVLLFVSDTGASWHTEITIRNDATLSGTYEEWIVEIAGDHDMLVKNCTFTGYVAGIKKLKSGAYSMNVKIALNGFEGESRLEGRNRYLTAKPRGIASGDAITLYLPGTAIESLPEGLTGWLLRARGYEPVGVLPCYCLHDLNTGYGFGEYL